MVRKSTFNDEEVLEACLHIFWSKGYDATSISDLENATGLVRTSLYNRFINKEKLFEEVIDHFIATQCVYWTSILLGQKKFILGVNKLITTMINENLDKDLPTGCLITYSAAGIDRHSADVRVKIISGHKIMIAGISTGLKDAVTSGELSSEIDIESMALFLLNNFQGIMVLSRTIGTKKKLNNIKKLVLATLSTYLN